MTATVSPLAERAAFPETTVYEQVGDRVVPWRFGSFEDDYKALREDAGVIDLSGAGLIGVAGTAGEELLERSFCREIAYLTPERSVMGLMLHDDGRPLDVVTVYRTDDGFLVETSPGRGSDVMAVLHARGAGRDGLVLTDETERSAVIGVEGPRSGKVLEALLPEPVDGLPFQGARVTSWEGGPVLVSRNGVTGEFGFKFIVPWDRAADLWRALTADGRPAGLEALETAMLEIRQPILQHEQLDDDTLVSAGLGWLVDFEKEEFVGREAVVDQYRADDDRRRISIVGDGPLAPGDPLALDGQPVGEVVFARFSPGLGGYCGAARVRADVAASGLVFARPDGTGAVRSVSSPARLPTSWFVLRELALAQGVNPD